ncbi:DUF5045 domain-containing protein [Parabacteroides sp. PF5-9]|uniref:DUF5045 domain-containing protein n=1 Tax=Parabacteroides sp. PF5-9 TaxID=1742404 RepID=UPI002474D955|nr:DUF5045 domain-containing protein [Parabacteroides sp. PF5-9]MDH6358927.1 molecular chaperone GrpE (heat shock protein) [Parabacteroides sp. PF5-9]
MRRVLTFLIFGLLITVHIQGQGFMMTEDVNRNHQIKSMVWQQWKLRPRWYYTFLHNSYKGTDRRTSFQLSPTVASTTLSEKKWEESHDSESIMYEQEMKKLADRTIDTEYLLKKEDLDFLKSEAQKNIIKMCEYADSEITDTFYDEYDRIDKNIEIIKDSHMENAKRRKAYQKLEDDLRKLISSTHSVNVIYANSQKEISRPANLETFYYE